MTVVEIHLLLHIYSRADYYGSLYCDKKFADQRVDDLIKAGFIFEDTSEEYRDVFKYKLTPKGEVFVKAILELPEPEQHWVMPK